MHYVDWLVSERMFHLVFLLHPFVCLLTTIPEDKQKNIYIHIKFVNLLYIYLYNKVVGHPEGGGGGGGGGGATVKDNELMGGTRIVFYFFF